MLKSPMIVVCMAAAGWVSQALAETDVADSTAPGSLAGHMHEHYDAVKTIQAAVIRGDLAAVAEPARWLAEHPTPAEIPGTWSNHVEAMRAAARRAAAATDITTAAAAASRMAHACGNCHVANEISGQFARLDTPEDELGSVAHMQRHQWAADRMWEGIIGPSNEAWHQGTDLLLEVPLSATEMHAEDDSRRSIRTMARRIHQLAANGMMEQDRNARVEIYAEFLANCAACHRRLGRGPVPD